MGDSDDGQCEKSNYKDLLNNLDKFYRKVKRQLIRHQSPTIGLFPRFGGDPEDSTGFVRDTIYCAYAVWALHQAYKKIDDDRGRSYELGQSAVKSMRGILFCWMKQADKLEMFKRQQSPQHALHSKFNLDTGETVTDDNSYGHLQIDAVALWLMALVQMISSGLQIVYTMDEVNFIQNLVYYVERAYRTPDYGMWERGTKYNNGQCELHASSVGMTKAALEAINGFNLFGDQGTSSSVIYVDIDAYSRNRTTFETLVPRESASKNVDVSLLPTLSWPSFALHEQEPKNRTWSKIRRRLVGSHGIKRFLRDGAYTTVEDRHRKFYTSGETKNFESIESEWPMFFLYFVIDSVFTGKMDVVRDYQQKIEPLLKLYEEGNYTDLVVPHYYYVPEHTDMESASTDAVIRKSSNEWRVGKLFLWAQSLYIISQLLVEGLLHVNDLDPVRRHLPASERPRKSIRYSFFQIKGTASDLVIQVAIISESMRLQSLLATYGIQSQTPHQIDPIQIWRPKELVRVFSYLGVNRKMGLTGRPPRPIGILGTSKIYRVAGTMVLCYPLILEVSDFYLAYDMKHTIEDIKTDLVFLSKAWKLSGRPTFCMLLREENVRGGEFHEMLDLLAQFKKGEVNGVQVRTGRLQNLIGMACIEHLDFFHHVAPNFDFHPFEEVTAQHNTGYKSLTDVREIGKRPSTTIMDIETVRRKSTYELTQAYEAEESLRDKAIVLKVLLEREGGQFQFGDENVNERLEKLFRFAGSQKAWYTVRTVASSLRKLVDSLMPSITSILVRGKHVTVGVFGHEEEVIDKPITPAQLKDLVYNKCVPYSDIQAVLQQEVILAIGKIIASTPTVFEGILKIRIGWVIHAMMLEYYRASPGSKEQSFLSQSPSEIKRLLCTVLTFRDNLKTCCRSPLERRQLDGALCRVPRDFYGSVWNVLTRTPGGIKVAGQHLAQQPTLSEMTLYELNFSIEVEHLLSRIADPAYRCLTVELFSVVAVILRRNPEVRFPGVVDMDAMITSAVEDYARDNNMQTQEFAQKLSCFSMTGPHVMGGTTSYMAKAVVNHLMKGDIRQFQDDEHCAIS